MIDKMITKENILLLKTRQEIYNYILKNPGMHLREISRTTKISYSILRHHLNFLEKLGLISAKSGRRFTRYYTTGKVSRNDKEIINVMREEIPRTIVILLLSPGPIENFKDSLEEEGRKLENYLKTYSKKEIVSLARFWGKEHDEIFHVIKHRSTIDFHFKKLIDAGIVEKLRVGKEMKYRLKNEYLVWEFLIRNSEILSDKLVTSAVNGFKDWTNEHIDLLIEGMLEIFPHPYYA